MKMIVMQSRTRSTVSPTWWISCIFFIPRDTICQRSYSGMCLTYDYSRLHAVSIFLFDWIALINDHIWSVCGHFKQFYFSHLPAATGIIQSYCLIQDSSSPGLTFKELTFKWTQKWEYTKQVTKVLGKLQELLVSKDQIVTDYVSVNLLWSYMVQELLLYVLNVSALQGIYLCS